MTMTTKVSTSAACPSWCALSDCDGDHWSEPDSTAWPAVRATAWAKHDTPTLVAHPTWGQAEGLSPAVALWMTGSTIDHNIDMTPDEAMALAAQLLRAAEAVKNG